MTLDDRLNAAPADTSMRETSMRETSMRSEGGDRPMTTPVVRTRKSLQAFQEELKQETVRQTEEGAALNSVSAVQAKINLLKAYEEEQAIRVTSLEQLQKLAEQLQGLGCPVQDKIDKRCADVTESVEALAAAALAYKADLDECLAKHKSLDDKRLAFAKRAEALNRWLEEAIDTMTEAVEADTVADADAADAELAALREELTEKSNECASLAALKQQMDAEGAVGKNPYTRFQVSELQRSIAGAEAAASDRVAHLAAARERIADLDGKKKEFAAMADEILAFVKAERAAQEQKLRGQQILPDDMESIMRGNESLAYLNEYASKAPERAERLAPAQSVYDMLMAAAEMDNPYTRQSIASLKSAIDQLEKLVRDAINLIEGQLARAQASITPEQKAELEEAFHHFDRSGDGKLNKLEYAAAMKSLDFDEVAAQAEFSKFAKLQSKRDLLDGTGSVHDNAIDLDAFITVVLQQYKDKDTMEGLLAAFRTVANGKELLQEADLKCLKPPDAAFLTERLVPAAEGLDFVPFAKTVYGDGNAVPLS